MPPHFTYIRVKKVNTQSNEVKRGHGGTQSQTAKSILNKLRQ